MLLSIILALGTVLLSAPIIITFLGFKIPGINSVGVQEIFILLVVIIAAWYRFYERWPRWFDPSSEGHHPFLDSGREKYAIKLYQQSLEQHKNPLWWQKERDQIIDYFNISRWTYERKRDRLVSNVLQASELDPRRTSGNKGSQAVRQALEIAEKTLQATGEHQTLKQMEHAMQIPCPDCNGAGFQKTNEDGWKECPTCKDSPNNTVPRFWTP